MSDGSLKLRGRVRAVLGDNVDTDIIYPGRYLNITDREKTAEHLFELAYPELLSSLEAGDIIVAGRNFGCGSSREQAAAALKFAGVGAVIAGSFARIFFRNAINLGLPAVVAPEIEAPATRSGKGVKLLLAAVASIAFGKPYAVLDGNVARVMARVTNDAGDIRAVQTRGRLRQLARRLRR